MTVTPSSQSVEMTRTAKFYAMAKGVGEETFTYQWMKDGRLIKNETGSNLMLRNIKESESGVYTVSVSNKYGDTDVSHPVFLSITSECQISKIMHNIHVNNV